MATTDIGIVSIHRARGNVSKDALDTGMMRLVDALVDHPFVQQRWNKVELVLQTPDLIEHFKNVGLDHPFPTAVMLVECSSVDDYVQVINHPDLDSVFAQAETQFGFKSNGSAFSADVTIRLHRPAPDDGKPHSTAMALMKVPRDLHPQEHHDALGPRFDEWVNMPQQDKYLRKHVLWAPNDELDGRLGEIGFPAREHLLVSEIQGETLDDLKAIIEHPTFDDLFQGHTEWGKLWGGAFKKSDCFSSNVTTRLTRDKEGRVVVFPA